MKQRKNNKSRRTILYECDPLKNVECDKTACKCLAGLSDIGYCSLTTKEKYAKEGGKKHIALKNGQLIDMDKLD